MNRCILFFVDSLYPLGDAQQLNLLLGELTKTENEIHLGVFQNGCSNAEREFYEQLDVTLHVLRKVPRRDFRIFRRVSRLIKQIKPSIVHSWCDKAGSVTALALSRSAEPPFVHTELTYVNEAPLSREIFERAFCRHPDRWIIPHECLAHNMHQRGARPHRLSVIPCAVSTSEIDRSLSRQMILERFRLPESAIIVGQVAPLEPKMRLKDSIWAADLLACVRKDVHFILIGDGEQKWRLRKFLSQTEATGHVHFVDHSELDANHENWLAGLDVYWHSHLQRPLDGCLLWAMELGIPVVAVYGTGTREIITPQVSGLATNFGARDEFARWTKYLIEQSDSAKQVSLQGQAHARAKFAIKEMVQGYQKVYDEVTS